ncbi:MAG TPA: GIY-YIG nuclease family protein [Gemmatimonadaceae bacterium]|nr:GIY-YIG nuclease family protein [Gemmatimonadaceae bacterium]
MVTKEEILTEIRRTAAENGGVALGKKRFLDATGIAESDWSGRYWARWGDALREAGVPGQQLNPRLDDEVVLRAAAAITCQLGRFPTAAEIRLAVSANSQLPSHNTFRRFGGLAALRTALAGYAERTGDALLSRILAASGEPVATPRTAEESPLAEGFVYLVKAGRHYKIGKANSVDVRHRQLAIQLPEKAEVVHRIRTDDPYGVEAYSHRRFAEKRLNGEWFALAAEDVKLFKRRRFM